MLCHFLINVVNLLFLFPVLISCSEHQVHNYNLVRNDDWNIKNGVIFRSLLEYLNKPYNEIAIVYDFRKEYNLKSDKKSRLSKLATNCRVHIIAQ